MCVPEINVTDGQNILMKSVGLKKLLLRTSDYNASSSSSSSSKYDQGESLFSVFDLQAVLGFQINYKLFKG